MAAASKPDRHLHVAVYWGGAELGSYCKPLKSCRGVTAGKAILSDIRSVIWPKWDDLDIILRTSSGLVLNPNLAWYGVLSDGRSTHVLSANTQRRQLLEVKEGTTASLRFEDLAVAIKVGPKPRKESTAVIPAKGFSAGLLSLFADRSNEWITATIGVAAAAVIGMSAYITLSSRGLDRYSSVTDLPDNRLLPFIAPKYLAEAPEVMQSGLDRFNYVHSVWNFYNDFASVVALGEAPSRATKVFPSTIDTYKSQAAAQTAVLADSRKRQEYLQRKSTSSISIPVVRGESATGRVIRTLDKIAVVSSTAKLQAARRNEVATDYEKDLGYKYSPPADDGANKAFAAISAGFLGLEDDETAQATQARHFSNKSALARMSLYGKSRLLFGPVDCCQPPVGAPLSHESISWLRDFSGPRDAEHIPLASLKASTWGAPAREKPAVIEPKSGTIAQSLVEKTIAAGRYQVRLCYELSLRRNQVTSGTMEWKWLIDTQGKITSLELVRSSIKDEELVKCVRQKIASWKFARPRGGSVEIRYPFEFSRDKG
jgi:hypothetical protein